MDRLLDAVEVFRLQRIIGHEHIPALLSHLAHVIDVRVAEPR